MCLSPLCCGCLSAINIPHILNSTCKTDEKVLLTFLPQASKMPCRKYIPEVVLAWQLIYISNIFTVGFITSVIWYDLDPMLVHNNYLLP